MTKSTPTKLIQIFRAGKHTDVNGVVQEFTQADIQAIADSYDAAESEAPLVIGHPKINAPAYGWAKSLVAQGDLLLAEPHQVEASFAEMVNAGRFKKRSASFFMPNSPGNPKPGQFYLRHIGFLGAAAPAVKGLRDTSFADGGTDYLEFAESDTRWGFSAIADLFSRLRDRFIETDGLEVADQLIADWQINSIRDAARPPSDAATPISYAEEGEAPQTMDSKEDEMTLKNAEFAEREEQLSTKSQEIADREAALLAREATAKRADAIEFADGLVVAGKLLPKDKATAVELLLTMPVDTTVSFADGSDSVSKSAPDLMRDFLSGLPKIMDFSEKSGSDAVVIDFADPQAIASAAVQYQKTEADAGREVSIANAVHHINNNKGSN